MWLQTVVSFLGANAATGITYKLFNRESNESDLKLIVMHILIFGICFLVSYFGHKTAVRKGQM